jgi:HK97 family phage major capsid protein
MEKFVEKSAEVLAKMSAEELASYYNAKNENTAAEIKSLKETSKTSEEKAEALASKISQLEADKLEQLKSLNETLKQHGIAIKKLSTQEKADRETNGVTMFDALKKHSTELTEMKEDRSKSISFKAAATMLISSNVSGGNVPVEQRLAGLNEIASRRIRLFDIVTRGAAESNVISWVYQANKDGAAGGTAEGALKNQIDFDLVVNSETVKKRTAYIKISKEMLGDIAFMETEVNNELMRELVKDVESQVYEGDNTGSNLNGIRTVATAFAAGTFAASVDNANIVDVLRVAMNQVKIADHDGVNYILMNPSDITALKLIKVGSTDNRYVDQLQMVAGQLSLDGVMIIESTLVAQDDYLVGNFDLATIYDRGQVEMSVGFENDDFTKNLVTILAEWRGLVVVKNNDRTAFVKGDFTTDKAAIETP